MHRPLFATALLVAPLVGFNLASVVDVCDGGPGVGVAAAVRSDEVGQPEVGQSELGQSEPGQPLVDGAYRAGRGWGAQLASGAGPVEDDACAQAATRWWGYELSSSPGSAPDDDARDGYQQGCADGLAPDGAVGG